MAKVKGYWTGRVGTSEGKNKVKDGQGAPGQTKAQCTCWGGTWATKTKDGGATFICTCGGPISP